MNTEMSGSEADSDDMGGALGGQDYGAADSEDDESVGHAVDSEDEGAPFRQHNGGGESDEEEDEEEEEEEDDDDALPAEEEEDDEPPPDEEEEEDDDNDDDECREEARRDGEPGTGANAKAKGKLHQSQIVLTKPSAASKGKSKKAEAAIAVVAPTRPAPLTQPSSKGAAKGASKGSKAAQPKTFSAQTDDGSGDDLASMTMTDLSNKGVPMPPPDAVQEFEEHRAGLANGIAAGDVDAAGLDDALSHTSVHESAHERIYLIKNEKVNKWVRFNPEGFVYAPNIRNPESSSLFEFTVEQLGVPSKKERVAMQEKLIDAHGTQAMNTVCIAKVKADGSGSGAGPGMHTLLMLLPGRKVPAGFEMEDIEAKMKEKGIYDADAVDPQDRKEIVVMMMLDQDVAKRLYKIDKNPLPQAFNPNINASTKYKVPARLEDTAKVDNNVVVIGQAEKSRRAGKRASEDGAANGSRADAKRQTLPSLFPAEITPEEAVAMDAAAASPGLAMKVFNGKRVAFAFAELTCAWNESYSVTQVGKGKWVLIKALDA